MINNWGRNNTKNLTAFRKIEDVKGLHFIPYGNGRSYGDSALGDNVLLTRKNNRFLSLNEDVLIVEAGALLSEIIDAYAHKGLFPYVVPGTKLVTVGGAIASDVHGKNHHKEGSFCDHVLSIKLALPSGKLITCSKEENPDFFKATCGGMGLTGVITEATLQLRKIPSTFIKQASYKNSTLEETLNSFEAHKEATYSVAWIDCVASGGSLGQSILFTGEHAEHAGFERSQKAKVSVPFEFPDFALQKWSVSLFNKLYYATAAKNGYVSLQSFFFPLDSVKDWNLIYGRHGFVQYQFVIPKENALEGLTTIMQKISDSGRASFLAVLKEFGKGNDNYLSFPMEGFTLALDFKLSSGLYPFLKELDKEVIKLGGRFYLTKDNCVSKEDFEKGYPELGAFRAFREKHQLQAMQSFQSERLGL